MSLALITTLCIAMVEPQTLNGATVVSWQRFEQCPVAEHVKFAPPMKYPTAQECKISPKLKGCDYG